MATTTVNTKIKSHFIFPEFDKEGLETLEAISTADRLNDWMYEVTSKNLQGNILEVGSGIGNISSRYIRDKRSLHLSDIRPIYCELLADRFGSEPCVSGVSEIDIADPEFEAKYSNLLDTFDGVFALNVVEHIENDSLAIQNCMKLLKPGGRLVILVPAYQNLYNGFDIALEHYRRYDRKSLCDLFKINGVDSIRSRYFNLAGIAGWFVSGKLMKNETIPGGQMKLYNRLVPIFKILDELSLHQAGLSVIAEGIKTPR